MSRQLVISPEAEQDITDARAWYEARQAGTGDRFLRSVEETLHRIEQLPSAAAEVFRGARQSLIRRFPYSVVYRVGADHIAIIAVYHTSRNPRGWQSRV